MGLPEVLDREAENQRVSAEVYKAADRLNDAVAAATRVGVSVRMEVQETADSSDKIIRNILVVAPMIILRY